MVTFENEHISYKNREGFPINFEKKRLDFWLHTVPEDIRRLEYELWRRYRLIQHSNLYRFENQKKIGRASIKPPYTVEKELIDWNAFGQSFLQGSERHERFQEIIVSVEADIPTLLQTYSSKISGNRVILIALAGSSVYGPRREGERFADIDLNILFDTSESSLNFEIMPDQSLVDFGKPYHIIGSGLLDSARGPHSDFHFLLLPHYPIQNYIATKNIEAVISELVVATQARKGELEQRIIELDALIGAGREEEITGYTK